MTIVVTSVTSQESDLSDFETLFSSSLPYMNADNNPWIGISIPEDNRQSFFQDAFFSCLNDDDSYIIKVTSDATPISMFSGKMVNGLYEINWALYNNISGTRSWLYNSTIMTEYLIAIKNFFNSVGVIGYTVIAPYNSTLYNYHKLNKPTLHMHTTITEEVHPQLSDVRLITYLF